MMGESIADLTALERSEAYRQLASHAQVLLDGISDEITAMATIVALVHHSLGFLWTGFYRLAADQVTLRVGPYQGSVGCLEIPLGKGVCGTAAAKRQAIIVDDVSNFPGHITCDPQSRSEIVVPVFNFYGALIAVLDIDADRTGAFSKDDEAGLGTLLAWFRTNGSGD